jgi:UDP:flavonoid glycosyltransferase YjiC (YdhE family)
VVLTDFAYGDQRSPGSQAPPDLDDLADTVLLTGGTGRMIREDFYPAAIAGLVAAGRPGIVVTPHEDLLPRVLPGNVVHRRALPFAEVMPAVGAVVHHGGAGTIARAVRSAVPQLLLADGGDRPDNGQRLEKLDLARSLTADDWSATTIGTEINRMMTAERRAKAVAFAASTRQQGRTGPSLVDRLLTW